MKLNELIQHSFETLEPSDTLAQNILNVTQKKTNQRILPRAFIAAAIVSCMILSVAAVGLTTGWLDAWFDTDSNEDYLNSSTVYPAISNTVDGLTLTLDKLLTDGPFLYFQLTVESDQGEAPEVFTDIYPAVRYLEPIAYTHRETGTELLDHGPGVVGSDCRLDDGSNPGCKTYTIALTLNSMECYEVDRLILKFYLNPSEEELAAAFPYGVPAKELLQFEFATKNSRYREASMVDGTPVRLYSLGISIQGYEFFGYTDENGNRTDGTIDATPYGIVLKDGTKMHFRTATLGYDDNIPSEQWWNACPLGQVINPEDVVAVFTPNEVLPLE